MTYRKTILCASIVAALSLSSVAYAQETVEQKKADAKKSEELETIVVRGIRESLQRSLDSKREAAAHVEVITAEDVGKMPDKNIADSLSRVPGVTISSASATEGGFDENDRVSMRGTNPSLTQTLINGHSVSSGDWFVLNQTGTVGRSVSYSLLPSELVGQVIVHKTAQASQLEGGVVGTVDIRTRKPLDFNKPVTLEGSVGMVYADLPSKTDPQFSGLANWQNDNHTLGIMVQAFSETRHLRRDGQELLGYEQIGATSAVATAHPDLANVWYPVLIGSALFEQERKRQGGLIEIDLRPSDNFSLDLTGFSSKMDAQNYNRNYMLWATNVLKGGAGQSPNPGYVVRNGTLVSAAFSPVAGTTYGVYDQISRPDAGSDSNFVNLDATWQATSALEFTGKFGRSKGHGKTPTQDVAEWNTGVGTGAAWGLNGISSAASWSLGSENTGSPAANSLGWIFGAQNVKVNDDDKWAQLDGDYAFLDGALTHLKFGVRSNNHDRDADGAIGQGPRCSNGDAFNWDPATFNCPIASTSPFNPANYPSGFHNYPGDFGDNLGGSFPRNIWYYTPGQLNAYNDKFTNRDPVTRAFWNADYALEEKNRAAYVQADFAGNGWAADLGVRIVNTKEHVIANVGVSATTPGAITSSAFGPYLPVAFDNDYHDVLPSGNLKFDLNEDMVLRFAASKTMTRADYSALAGAISLSPPADLNVPGATGSGSGSNPNLKPVRSTNLDASWEWYFAPRALISASLFHMDLTSYIGLGHVTESFVTFDQAHPNGISIPYVLTVPINSSGSVKGAELSFEMPVAEHFGVFANYTYADGEEDGGGPLVGTSKTTYNVGGYFEDERFNARVAYTHRSDFYSGLDRSTAFYQAASGNLAASFGYKFNEHFMLTLDALNLNDPKLKYYALNKDQPRSVYQNGRQYYLNLRVKF